MRAGRRPGGNAHIAMRLWRCAHGDERVAVRKSRSAPLLRLVPAQRWGVRGCWFEDAKVEEQGPVLSQAHKCIPYSYPPCTSLICHATCARHFVIQSQQRLVLARPPETSLRASGDPRVTSVRVGGSVRLPETPSTTSSALCTT
jgi:hypothetical protein